MNEKVLTKQDWRWQAVRAKQGEFDGVFFFAVRTTGIFCRPSCSSRTPRLENVLFFDTAEEAERADLRACLRCRPKDEYSPNPAADLVDRAFKFMSNDEIASVDDLSQKLGVSVGHLQKVFRSIIGVSPKEVLERTRMEKFKENVRTTDVTTSLYESGFGSSRSLYEKAGANLGMTPATYKKGGAGIDIKFTIVDSPLGKMLVAATNKGICSVSFGDDADELAAELEQEFFAAKIQKSDAELEYAVGAILKSLDGETTILDLPLDVRATAFQIRVWSELRKIPFGETRSYGEIAKSIGDKKSVRAVARACATNPVALVNPCHRVIAADGKLSGYKWGIERKARLLDRERKDEN